MLRIIRKTIATAAVLSIALAPSVALAADICLVDGVGLNLVFHKPKKLKSGRSIAITGIRTNGLSVALPLYGTALMRTGGTVDIGFTQASMQAGIQLEYAGSGGNADFEFASVSYDNTGDGVADGTTTLTKVDCDTVIIP